jgi:hypothetical protein
MGTALTWRGREVISVLRRGDLRGKIEALEKRVALRREANKLYNWVEDEMVWSRRGL